jgi:hypothetical protein
LTAGVEFDGAFLGIDDVFAFGTSTYTLFYGSGYSNCSTGLYSNRIAEKVRSNRSASVSQKRQQSMKTVVRQFPHDDQSSAGSTRTRYPTTPQNFPQLRHGSTRSYTSRLCADRLRRTTLNRVEREREKECNESCKYAYAVCVRTQTPRRGDTP